MIAVAISIALLVATPRGVAAPSFDTDERPLAVLFGPAQRTHPALSGDGGRLAWVAPLEHGRSEVWIGRVTGEGPATEATRIATLDGEATRLAWADGGRTIVAATERRGDGVGAVFAIDIASGDASARVPDGVSSVELLDVRDGPPAEALVRSTLPPRDVFRVRLDTGAAACVVRDTLGALEYGFDGAWEPRLAIVPRDDGSRRGWIRRGDSAAWEHFRDWEAEVAPSTRLLGVTRDGRRAHLIDSSWPESAGLAALVRVDLVPASERPSAHVLAASTRWVPHTLISALGTGEPLAAIASFERDLWKSLSTSFEEEIAMIRKLRSGDFRLVSRSDDDRQWLLAFSTLAAPDSYWLWDRLQRRGRLVLTARDDLDADRVMSLGGFRVRMRDGLELPVFVTVPADADGDGSTLHPTVILLRDGLWSRAHQLEDRARLWLADRGYVVLSIVVRGAPGLSPALSAAGAGGWNSTIPEDIEDALAWATTAGFSDGVHVGILGDGLGASAALAAAAHAPTRYTAVAAIDPTLDFRTAPLAPQVREQLCRAVGSGDEAVLVRESPSRVVPRLGAPVLLAFGGSSTDADADAFLAELQALGRSPVVVPRAKATRRIDGQEKDLLLAVERFFRDHLHPSRRASGQHATQALSESDVAQSE
ncbi:MAG: prolyl oligopeptidase family serine peptidase [Phycisphaerae bacterium]|nr:prolyl oligopeptidase family serine peptidase [Phycisphaerae bacterium]